MMQTETEFIHLFVATGLTRGAARPEFDEPIEVEAAPWDEALRRVRAGDIQDAKSVSALLLVEARFAKSRSAW
jgi:ADP-ribose pyrophosphatase